MLKRFSIILAIISLPAVSVLAQWTEPVIISEYDSKFQNVDMVSNNQDIFAVYYNYSYDPLYPRFVSSNSCGWDWSEPFNLADTADGSGKQPRIALAGDTLHVVWRGFRNHENPRVNYRRSPDLGNTWEATQLITDAYTYMKYPSIIEYNGYLFCAYNACLHNSPYDTVFIMGISSADGGDSWGEHFRISPEVTSTFRMTLMESQGRFHLIYQGLGPDAIEIAYIYSDDLGATWSEPVLISPVDEYAGQWPHASVDSTGFLAACWFDYKYGSNGGFYGDILMNYSIDNGDTWHGEVRVTYEHSNKTSAILTDNPNIYVAYEDIRNVNKEIYFRRSGDRGQNWFEEERITNDADLDSDYPDLSISNCGDVKTLHLVWSQEESEVGYIRIVYSQTEIQTEIAENDNYNIPDHFGISSVYPNPFNSSVKITVNSPSPGKVRIYDILGRVVNKYAYMAGKSSIIWDARDLAGQPVSAGIYFAVAGTALEAETVKLVYLK